MRAQQFSACLGAGSLAFLFGGYVLFELIPAAYQDTQGWWFLTPGHVGNALGICLEMENMFPCFARVATVVGSFGGLYPRIVICFASAAAAVAWYLATAGVLRFAPLKRALELFTRHGR
jgi:hypothetical protein